MAAPTREHVNAHLNTLKSQHAKVSTRTEETITENRQLCSECDYLLLFYKYFHRAFFFCLILLCQPTNGHIVDAVKIALVILIEQERPLSTNNLQRMVNRVVKGERRPERKWTKDIWINIPGTKQ